jgi:hypothetical protein
MKELFMLNFMIKISSLLFILFFLGCIPESDSAISQQPIPKEFKDEWKKLKGKWSPFISLSDNKNNIITSRRINFTDAGLEIFQRCKRDDKLFVDVYETIPFDLKNGVIDFKKNIDIKVPFRINNDKIEMPKDIKNIKNFPIDGNTLYCNLEWEKGEWKYKIEDKKEGKILEIFREIGDIGLGPMKTGWSFHREQ